MPSLYKIQHAGGSNTSQGPLLAFNEGVEKSLTADPDIFFVCWGEKLRCGSPLRQCLIIRTGQFRTITAASWRMKPGGRPCLERISNQPKLESTTLTFIPTPISAISAEFSVGPL